MNSVRWALVPSVYALVGLLSGLSGCGDQLFSKASEGHPAPEGQPPLVVDRLGPLSKVAIQGTVVSAFQIQVDGKSYADSEDFYSQELGRLGEKIAAAGFSDWQARFEAVLGFNDLSRGMTVFVAPVGNRGPAGQAQVSLEGNFRVELPASDDSTELKYNIRAVKRVNVVLTRGEETRKFCYNFSAVEKDIGLSSSAVALIQLDTFETRLTTYACDSQQDGKGGSVPVPAVTAPTQVKPAPPLALPEPVSFGDTAENVAGKFGDPEKITRVTPLSARYRLGYDFYWAYSKLPGTAESLQCLFYFSNQEMIAYERCPAVLVEFGANRANTVAKPNDRITYGDSPESVLAKWGLPSLVSLSVDSQERSWQFSSSALSPGSCVLKFRYDQLQQYSGNCKLSWIAHWTF